MKNLILGGAGFIGQHLTRRLLDKGDHVAIVDNLKTAKFSPTTFAHFGDKFEFFEQNLLNISHTELVELFGKFDKIYYLAGSVGVEFVDKNPNYTTFNNIDLARKLVPAFEEVQKHVVFSSTSEVYGNGPTFREGDPAVVGSTNKLRWAYATTKLLTEFMIRSSTFPYTIVRFFNVVGPGQLADFGMVLPRFVLAALKNEKIIVHGDGLQIRSFCHINDAIDALEKVSDINGELFNIGNDSPITIRKLANLVKKLTNSESEIINVPYNQVFSKNFEDIRYRVPNLEKLKGAINYAPSHTLDDIINDTARYYN